MFSGSEAGSYLRLIDSCIVLAGVVDGEVAGGKNGIQLPWREARPPSHRDDKVDSDQEVVNKELSL